MKKPLALCLALVVLFAVSILVGNEPPLAKPEPEVPLGDPIPAVESPVTLPEPGQHEKPEGIPAIPVGPGPVVPEKENPDSPTISPNDPIIITINGVEAKLDPKDPEALVAKNTELSDEVKALMDQTGKDHETIVRDLWKLHWKMINVNDSWFSDPSFGDYVPGFLLYDQAGWSYSPMYEYGKPLQRIYTENGIKQLMKTHVYKNLPMFLESNDIIYRKNWFASGWDIADDPVFRKISETGTAETYHVDFRYISFDLVPSDPNICEFIVEARSDGLWKIESAKLIS